MCGIVAKKCPLRKRHTKNDKKRSSGSWLFFRFEQEVVHTFYYVTPQIKAILLFFSLLSLPLSFRSVCVTHEHRKTQYQQRPGPHDPHEDPVFVKVVLTREIVPAISEVGVDELTQSRAPEYHREQPDLRITFNAKYIVRVRLVRVRVCARALSCNPFWAAVDMHLLVHVSSPAGVS